MKKKNQKEELGKGIRALLGDINEEVTLDINEGSPTGQYLPIDSIEVNPFQPRVEFDKEQLENLAQSIKAHGVIQPITVRELKKGKYQLISGERRWRASQLSKLKEIPAFVKDANDQESLEMALIENIQREDLNAIEISLTYQRLLDECELSHEELADRMGKKRATITNYLRLLKLPPDIQVGVREGSISMAHARAIAGIEEAEVQLKIFSDIVSKRMSVRQTEQLVAKLNSSSRPNAAKSKQSDKSPEVEKWQDKIATNLGTKVIINHSKNGSGKIILPYIDNDDFERLIDLLDK